MDWEALSKAARDSVRVSTKSCPWMDGGQVERVRGILAAASQGWEQRDWPVRIVDGRYEEIKP